MRSLRRLCSSAPDRACHFRCATQAATGLQGSRLSRVALHLPVGKVHSRPRGDHREHYASLSTIDSIPARASAQNGDRVLLRIRPLTPVTNDRRRDGSQQGTNAHGRVGFAP